MTSIIQTSVLRAAVLSAFDRGRYTVHFGTAPAGDDIAVVPSSINLDLAERDDDLLGSEPFELFTEAEVRELRREVAAYQPESIVAGVFGADDHGPAVPVQDGPRVYEFALQDAIHTGPNPTLADIVIGNAPDLTAFAYDWVHVYDRVTRERRTLKRPAVDKIVKGMSELVAGLRGHPVAMAARAQGKSAALSDAAKAALGDDLVMRRAAVEAGYARLEGYVPMITAPVPVPAPAPGPLTSAEGLVRGDVLRAINSPDHFLKVGSLHRFVGTDGEEDGLELLMTHELNGSYFANRFAFVGRPDADGWMDWTGGENPVGDAQVLIAFADGTAPDQPQYASSLRWTWRFGRGAGGDILRFRLLDTPPMPGDQST